MLISLCIPTYNRLQSLKNCLNSLSLQTNLNFEVCISDNFSSENIENIIKPFQSKLKIKFSRNNENLGAAPNFMKVASMAENKFIWFLGDDDLLVPDAIEKLIKLIEENEDCDFFWINSYHLKTEYLQKFDKPFNTEFLPKDMKTISSNKISRKLMFFDLIRHSIAFDFLMGCYLCVFRRKGWEENLNVIDTDLVNDKRTWSNFDNTCFHIKIFGEAFKDSKAYFCAEPLSVNTHGLREWNDLYPLVEIVRIPEALDYFRSKGMNFFQYIYEKNYSLRNFFNYFIKISLNGNKMGLEYISFKNHFFKNLIYPNSWLSIFYFFARKLLKLFKLK